MKKTNLELLDCKGNWIKVDDFEHNTRELYREILTYSDNNDYEIKVYVDDASKDWYMFRRKK